MRNVLKAGTELRLLCLPLALAALAACERHQTQPHAQKMDEGEETRQLLEATKNNPSLQPGSNEAGPPINVDPYPKPTASHHEHAQHNMAE